MRALVQRVSSASVTISGETVGSIGAGLLVLVCAMAGDTDAESDWLARKVVNLRIFRDGEKPVAAQRQVDDPVNHRQASNGRMNRSLIDTGGAALVVSQFTLAAETKGNRPGFSSAAAPDEGRRLYEHFSRAVAGHGVTVENGVFGADMKVALVNDGPVTIWLDTAAR